MVNKKQTQYNEILNERVKLNWVKVETQVKHHQKKLANNAKDHRKLLWNLLRTESLLEQKVRENLQVQTQFSNIIESAETGSLKSIQFFKNSDLITLNNATHVLTSDEEQTNVTTFHVHKNSSQNPNSHQNNTHHHPHQSNSSKNPTSSYFIQKFSDILKDFKKLPDNRQTDIQDKYLSQPSIEATLNLAQAHFYSGDNEKAIEKIREAIATKRDEQLEKIIYSSRNQNEGPPERNITNSSTLYPSNVDALTVLHLRLFAIAYSILGLLSQERAQQLLYFKNAVDRSLGYLSLHQLASLKILPNIVAIAVCRYVKLKLEDGRDGGCAEKTNHQTKRDVFLSIIPYLCETDVYPEKTVKEIPESVNNVSLRTLITRLCVDSGGNSPQLPISQVSTSQFSTIWHLANNISSSSLILCFDEFSDEKEVSDLFKILDLALRSCQIPYGQENSESEKNNWYKIGECFRTLGKIDLANASYLKCGDGDFRANLRLGHTEISSPHSSDSKTYPPYFQQKLMFWNRLQIENHNLEPSSDDASLDQDASNDYLIHFLHARFLTISGKDMDSALKSIKTSVSLNSEFSHSWLLFAIILSIKGAHRKAIQAISFGRRQANDKLDLVIRLTELEAHIYENAGVSGLCFEEKSVKLENSVSTQNFIEDDVENLENVENFADRRKTGKLTKVEKTSLAEVSTLDLELIDLEPEGTSDMEKWLNEAYKSHGTVISLCDTLIDQNDLNETGNEIRNFGSFNQFSNTKILPESHLETRSHNSKSYKDTTTTKTGPTKNISNGYSNSIGGFSTFGGGGGGANQNSISKQNSSQYFSHNQYLGTSNASNFNGSSNFNTLPNVQSHQIAAAQSTVFDKASLASHDSVQNNLSSGEVTLDFGVHTSNQSPVSFLPTRTISHVNVICRALQSQAEINLACAGSNKTESKSHKNNFNSPQIIEKQLTQLAKIKDNFVDPAVTAQIQYSILCYDKDLQDHLINCEDSNNNFSGSTSDFVSSTLQLNSNKNNQTHSKSVSTTLARAALTSIALDQTQVKSLFESESENKAKHGESSENENGGLKTNHQNHALQHLTKALELAYQLPSTTFTRQILEKRLLIRNILHKIAEHYLTLSSPPNHVLASNFLERVPGKNFETFSLFKELNFKQQSLLSSNSSFFVRNGGKNKLLSNILESSENEFSNIDSPEYENQDEEEETFVEVGQVVKESSNDEDIMKVLGLIDVEKTVAADFHDSDLVRRFLPVDFIQNLVFKEFFW